MLKDRMPVEYTRMESNKRTVYRGSKKGTWVESPSLYNKTHKSSQTQSQLHKGGSIITAGGVGSTLYLFQNRVTGLRINSSFQVCWGVTQIITIPWPGHTGPNPNDQISVDWCFRNRDSDGAISPMQVQSDKVGQWGSGRGKRRPLGLEMFLRRGARR